MIILIRTLHQRVKNKEAFLVVFLFNTQTGKRLRKFYPVENRKKLLKFGFLNIIFEKEMTFNTYCCIFQALLNCI